MRILITRTQVTKSKALKQWARGFLLVALVWGAGFGAPAAENDLTWSRSLVRLSLKYETSGVFHEGRLLHSRVIERTDFKGVVMDARGYIVSYVGSHWPKMASPQSRLFVEFSDGSSESARLVGVDERISVALVQSPGAARREVGLGSISGQKELEIADSADNHWHKLPVCPIDVSSSKLVPDKTIKARPCFPDANAACESGSFLLDQKGRFLGIVTEVEKVGTSKNLKAYRVVPTEVLNDSLRTLINRRENLRAGYLGIFIDPESKMVVVTGVEENTPAADAGLIAGDRIVAANSQPIRDLLEFGRILRWKGPGGRLELTVEREGEEQKLQAVLTSHPVKEPVYGWKLELPRIWGNSAGDEQELKLSPMPLPSYLKFGLVVDTISPQLASYFKVPSGKGLLVTSVQKESLASKSGFQAGDVLVEMNGRKLSSPSDMREVLYTGRDGVIVVRFVRDGVIQSRKLAFP